MKLAVFSDLHIAPGAANRCTASPAELLELFDHVERRADRVLVAGDLFDLDRPKLPGRWRDQLREIRRAFPQVTDRLESYEWIFGNHDGPLCRQTTPEERVWEAGGLRLLALHGHQFDMPLKKLPGLAPTANFVAGWMQRAGLHQLAGVMGVAPLLLDRLWHTASPGGSGPDRLLRGAFELLERGPSDLVICGHSHRLRLVAGPRRRGLFVNTGALCEGSVDWVLIDTEAARVRAFRDGQSVQQAVLSNDCWNVEGQPPDMR
ncbi:MAG: metallophosphoesterase family protein [Persicimonas sp.]